MHEAVCAAGWDSQALMRRHRVQVAHDHQRRGREVIRVDGTRAHHERGPHIFGVDQAYDDVQRRTARCQTVVTAVLSNRHVIDGLEVVGQEPKALNEEMADLEATSTASDEQMGEARQRVLERLPHRQHR
jgi:hypothetical protein